MDVSFPSLMLSPVWLVVAITVGYLFARAVYNVFFHPLAKVPGPFLASLTTKWIDIHDIAGCKALTVAPIHERFGPVVRIGPDELSFSDPALLKEIYGQATPYMKSALYSHLGVGTHDGIFDTQDREVHKRRRKLLSHVFAASSVNTCEPIIADHIRRLLSWIEKDSKMVPPQPTDVFIWFRMLSFDIAGSLFFGASFNALSSPTPPAYLDSLDAHFQGAGIRWHMPYVLSLTSWLPIPSWQHFLKASERLHAYGQTAFHDYVSRYGRDGSNSRVDLLKKVIAGTDSKEVAPLTDEEIICEAGTMIIGGTDTTSIVLTYLFWELARHPVWQDKLRDEFRANNVVFKDGVPSWQQVQSLEILDAVITEGLRLHPPAPGGLLRVVPKEGAELAGVRVPGGTTISMQAQTLHRNPDVFPSPDDFDPGRWLVSGNPDQLSSMQSSIFSWSRGSRACIGIHLATRELKLIVSSLVAGWGFRVAEGTTKEGMVQEEHFVGPPKAKGCKLIFTPVAS